MKNNRLGDSQKQLLKLQANLDQSTSDMLQLRSQINFMQSYNEQLQKS